MQGRGGWGELCAASERLGMCLKWEARKDQGVAEIHGLPPAPYYRRPVAVYGRMGDGHGRAKAVVDGVKAQH